MNGSAGAGKGPPETRAEALLREQILSDCLAAFPEVRFTVTGRCMSPDLAEGDVVRVRATQHAPPRFGDVVLTRHDGILRLHRLVAKPPSFRGRALWRTKADRALFLDPPVSMDEVLGTVVGVEGRAHARRPLRALRAWTRAAWGRARRTARRFLALA